MFPLVLLVAAACAIFIPSDTRIHEVKNKEKADPNLPINPPCSGNLVSSSFGDQTLHLCHLDKNRDGVFQSASEDLSVWDEKQWTSFKNPETQQLYKSKWGLPDFEGLPLTRWQRARNFIYASSHAKKWDVEMEKKISDIVEYHPQQGIDLGQSLLAAGKSIPSEVSPQQKIDALAVTSVLNFIKTKKTAFYQAHQGYIDSVSRKMEEKKLLFPEDLEDYTQKESSVKTASALYDPSTNSIRLVNRHNLSLKQFESSIVHELFHFQQDIEKKRISRTESETEAYLIEAEYTLSEAGLLEGASAPEKLEKFIEEYRDRNKLPKPVDDLEPDLPVIFALRTVYCQQHHDKELEAKNNKQLTYSNEYRAVSNDYLNFYREMAPGVVTDFRDHYSISPDDTPESVLKKIDRAIEIANKELENQVKAYSQYLSSINSPDLKEVEKYYKNALILGCAMTVYFANKSVLTEKKESEPYPFKFIKSVSSLYFNTKLLAAEDGVE